MLGYSRESFLEAMGITQEGFSDDTYSCGGCGKYDDGDYGYTHNHRIVNECEMLGVNCGCFQAYCESDEGIEEYVNKASKAMELESAEKLAAKRKLKNIERFIGGMVDGRGGHFGGESVNEGDPKSVLKALRAKHPNRRYVFTHDESGQFQTYFSVWQVASPGKRFAKAKA